MSWASSWLTHACWGTCCPQDGERKRLATLASIKSQFIELGFIRPVRREAGSAIRETDEEVEQQTFCAGAAARTRYTGTSCRRSRNTGAGRFSHSHPEPRAACHRPAAPQGLR